MNNIIKIEDKNNYINNDRFLKVDDFINNYNNNINFYNNNNYNYNNNNYIKLMILIIRNRRFKKI